MAPEVQNRSWLLCARSLNPAAAVLPQIQIRHKCRLLTVRRWRFHQATFCVLRCALRPMGDKGKFWWMSFPEAKRKSTFTNIITDSTAMLIKPNRARIGEAGAEGRRHGSNSRKGTKTSVSLALIVTIVAFKLLPDMSCEQVRARMAEVKCLIFNP